MEEGCLADVHGFTLLELLITLSVGAAVMAVAIPAFSSYYGSVCVKAAVWEIVGMVKEAKQRALCDGSYYAVGFDPAVGRVALLAGRGPDGEWNTADDPVVRSFLLVKKGGGVRFGYGSRGPIPGHAETTDGISLQVRHSMVCNPDLTCNAGTVYLEAASGAAMALTVNSRDFSCAIRRWNGACWVRM